MLTNTLKTRCLRATASGAPTLEDGRTATGDGGADSRAYFYESDGEVLQPLDTRQAGEARRGCEKFVGTFGHKLVDDGRSGVEKRILQGFLTGKNGGGGGSRTPVRKALRPEDYMLSSVQFVSPAALRMSKKRYKLVRWFSPELCGPKSSSQPAE
jgi:hypothetical protein